MRRVLVFTAYDRLDYLARTLEAWEDVRGLDRWDIVFRIEPSPVQNDIRALIWQWVGRTGVEASVAVNPERYGVLRHPWVAFEEAFAGPSVGFVLRAEDDLVVSTDTLEYFEWASEHFAQDTTVAAVIGYNEAANEDPTAVGLASYFNPWTWGCWRRSWLGVIRDTWDHDYSTFTDAPGHQSGWDANLGLRIFPQRGLTAVFPAHSRVDNIGVWGVHGNNANHRTSATFVQERPQVSYRLDERTIVQA